MKVRFDMAAWQMRCWPLLIGIWALGFLLVPNAVLAHKVTIFAWVEGHTVFTESKFSGGRVAKNARIEVYNMAGDKLLEGQTDEQGKFVFQPPQPEALRIVLLAGAGHRNEWRVAADEFGDGATATPTPQPVVPAAPATRDALSTDAHRPDVSLPAGELQALIERSLDKKLAPILHRLGTVDTGPSLSDIIGGIGYILGLVGLAAYLQSRRKSG